MIVFGRPIVRQMALTGIGASDRLLRMCSG
jgi:hypothetical protein